MRYLMRLNAEKGVGQARRRRRLYYVGGKTETAEKVVSGRYSKTKLLTSFTAVLLADKTTLYHPDHERRAATHSEKQGLNLPPAGTPNQCASPDIARPPLPRRIQPRFDLPPANRLIACRHSLDALIFRFLAGFGQKREGTISANSAAHASDRSQRTDPARRPQKVLLHSCCAPCSGEVMEAMLASGIDYTIFFYNPNIHPRAEYLLRKEENTRFAEKHSVAFVDADYDTDNWFARAKGMEWEPERASAAPCVSTCASSAPRSMRMRTASR